MLFWKKKKPAEPDIKLDTTLIDMDRTPTMEELRAFFKKHDWSAMKLDVDHENFTPEDAAHYKYLKELIHEKWEPLSREMGLKASHGVSRKGVSRFLPLRKQHVPVGCL